MGDQGAVVAVSYDQSFKSINYPSIPKKVGFDNMDSPLLFHFIRLNEV